jgi:hypothetical protein
MNMDKKPIGARTAAFWGALLVTAIIWMVWITSSGLSTKVLEFTQSVGSAPSSAGGVDSREARLRDAVRSEFPLSTFELKRTGSDDLDLFLSRKDVESVPFPDRAELFSRLGLAWCVDSKRLVFPSVRFRDLRTGATFGEYSCNLSKATVRTPED